MIPFHRLRRAPIHAWGRIILRFQAKAQTDLGALAARLLSPLRNGAGGTIGGEVGSLVAGTSVRP
jgi:hypothetical protein